MTTLPSFVELMATLGLENRPEPSSEGAQSKHHSRSSSYSSSSSVPSDISSAISTPHSNIFAGASPAIVVSQHEESPVDRDWEPERRRCRVMRYSPYSPSISHHMRRESMPSMKVEDLDQPLRALSTSPSPSSPIGRRSPTSAGSRSPGRRVRRMTSHDPDLIAYTPISSFVRRKTPTNSPTSPTFPDYLTKHTPSPSLPVALPSLPPILSPSLASRYSSPDSEDDDMEWDCVSDTSSNDPQTITIERPWSRDSVRVSAVSRSKALERRRRQRRHKPSIAS